MKKDDDELFSSLGLDISTAIRIFLNASIENAGIPFSVRHKTIPNSLQKAVYDSRYRQNLNGSFDTAEDAIASMLEDSAMYQICEDVCILSATATGSHSGFTGVLM